MVPDQNRPLGGLNLRGGIPPLRSAARPEYVFRPLDFEPVIEEVPFEELDDFDIAPMRVTHRPVPEEFEGYGYAYATQIEDNPVYEPVDVVAERTYEERQQRLQRHREMQAAVTRQARAQVIARHMREDREREIAAAHERRAAEREACRTEQQKKDKARREREAAAAKKQHAQERRDEQIDRQPDGIDVVPPTLSRRYDRSRVTTECVKGERVFEGGPRHGYLPGFKAGCDGPDCVAAFRYSQSRKKIQRSA